MKALLKRFWRKRLVRWSVYSSLVFVLIVNQLLAAGAHLGFVENAIKKSETRRDYEQKIVANWSSFRDVTKVEKERLAKAKEKLPVFREEEELFLDLAESHFRRNGITYKLTQKTQNLRNFYVDCVFSWEISGQSVDLMKAMREIDAEPRLVAWDEVPEDLGSPERPVEGEVKLAVYRFRPAPTRKRSEIEKVAPQLTPEYSKYLPSVWLPPFRWMAESAEREYNEYFASLQPIPHHEEILQMEKMTQESRMYMDILSHLDHQMAKLQWHLDGKPPLLKPQRKTVPFKKPLLSNP